MILRYMSQMYSFNKLAHFPSGHSLNPCLIQIKLLTLNFFVDHKYEGFW